MASPDFICIGAQKAGTTWLDKMFNSHVGIWTPPIKELQYFNECFMGDSFKWTKAHRFDHGCKALRWAARNDDIDWRDIELIQHLATGEISKSWYEKIFDYAPKHTIKGEMTPEYSLLESEHIKKISENYPKLKVIFVMRNPLERALSGIKMRLLQNGFDLNSEQQEIDDFVVSCAGDWDVIERGNYERIMNSWSLAFGEDNCIWLLARDLKNDPDAQLEHLASFLGTDASLFKANPHEKVHVGKSFTISDFAVNAVQERQKLNTEWFERNYPLMTGDL